MAKQRIEIGLSFSADTNKAKGSLQQLEKQLNSFLNNSVTDLPLTKSISAAQEQAAKLSVALKQAVNIDTGKFDLSKFQSSLKKSNTDLKTLRDSFVKAGPEGTKTFMALAQSIVAAEVPTKRMNAGLEKMLKTLKDTARWQISSNIMHGLQGALQDAYGYAQDLNKSLNDIRIVTGYNTDQMEDFAVSANKAAKALSTTTNEYTKASLIYFQQGLSDQEVTKRTQTTIKMANVTGEAAEDVSSYMTAVWNNFDDGSKKLEYYADAITALGAATASSSEEIATGLQKFSAVANTVGLSYEYATAALATVTSQTRESAETVGTAFKTIFARLESLSLGETLDDDTTMTKYSQALAQVGVNIKTANGDLKGMDTIIDELGSKWNSISKDQQIALAQTVAGMRQYNNFIALLDNYETMKLNVEIAADSEGTLDEQASIYAESWEAASDRVRAAAETIYEKILDDDFFIDLLNGFEKLLGLLDKFIDSAGGLQGILFGVSSILLKTFSGKAAEGLENMVYNFKEFFNLNKKTYITTKTEAANMISNIVGPTEEGDSPEFLAEVDGLKAKIGLQLEYVKNQEKMSEQQKLEYEMNMSILDSLIAQNKEKARAVSEAQEETSKIGIDLKRSAVGDDGVSNEVFTAATTRFNLGKEYYNEYMNIIDTAMEDSNRGAVQRYEKAMQELLSRVRADSKELGEEITKDLEDNIVIAMGAGNDTKLNKKGEWKDTHSIGNVRKAKKDLKQSGENINIKLEKQYADSIKKTTKEIGKYSDSLDKKNKKEKESKRSQEAVQQGIDKTNESMQPKKVKDYYKSFVDGAQAVTALTAAFSSLSTIWDTLQDPNLTGWEKFGSITMSLLTAIPLIVTAFQSLTQIQGLYNLAAAAGVAIQKATIGVVSEQAISQATLAAAQEGATVASVAQVLANNGVKSSSLANAVASKILAAAKTGETGAVWANNVAWYASPVLWIAAIIIAVVAAIALLVAGISALTNAINADANALKESEERLKSQKEALSEMKQAYEEVKTALSDYQTAYEGIQKMQEGTEEWRKAVQELNSSVTDLIVKYPQLSEAFEFNNGIYELKKGYDKQILDDMQSDIEAQELNVQISTISRNKAKMAADITSFKRHEGDWYDTDNWMSNIGSGAAMGAAVGMVGGPLVAGIAAIGGAIGGLTQSIIENGNAVDDMEDMMDQLAKEYASGTLALDDESLREALMRVSDNNIELTNHLMSNVNATRELIESNGQLIQQNKLLIEKSYYDANKDIIDNSDYGEYATAIATKDHEARVQTEREKFNKGLFGTWGQGTDAVAQEYLKATYGDNWADNYKIENTAGGNVTLKKKNEDGVWEEVDGKNSLSWDTIFDAVAEARAFEISEEDQKKYEEQGKAIESSLKESLSKLEVSLSDEEIRKMGLNVASGEAIDLSKISRDEFNKMYREAFAGLDEEEIKAQIENISNEEEKALYQAIYDQQKAWENQLSYLTKTSQDRVAVLSNSSIESLRDLSAQTMVEYGHAIDNLYQNSGIAAVNQFDVLTGQLFKENSDRAGEIAEIIASLGDSFSNPEEALTALQNKLYDIGIELKDPNQWNVLKQKLSDSFSVLKYDFQAIRTEIYTIKELVNDISFGDIITDEDFDKIRKYTSAANELFILTEDGYRFIGENSEQLKSEALSASLNSLKDGLKASETAIEANRAWSKWGTTDAEGNFNYINFSNYAKSDDKDKVLSLAASIAADDNYINDLEAIGENQSFFKEQLEIAQGDSAGAESAKQYIQSVFGKIAELQDKAKNGEFETLKDFELYASQFTSMDDLEKNYNEEFFEKEGITWDKNAEDALKKQINYIKILQKERLEEIDIYQDEEKAIEAVNHKIEKNSLAKEQAYGPKKIHYIKEEIALTQELQKANEIMYSQAKTDLQSYYNKLNSDFSGVVKFDAEGNLLNREELLKNNVGLNEEDYEALQELINNYDEAIEKSNEYGLAIEENKIALKDLALEKIQTTLELKLQINERDLKLLEYELSKLENLSFSQATQAANISEQYTKQTKIMDSNLQTIYDIGKEYNIVQREGEEFSDYVLRLTTANLPQNYKEQIEEANDSLIDGLSTLQEIRQTASDMVLSYLEELKTSRDETIGVTESLISLTTSYKDIMGLLGKDTAGDEMYDIIEDVNEAASFGMKKQLETVKATYNKQLQDKAILEEELTRLSEEGNDEQYKIRKEALDQLNLDIIESQQLMADTLTSTIELLTESMTNTIDNAIAQFEEKLTGAYGSLERLSEAFDQQSTLNNQYVADYKKIYELSKLTRNIEGQINNSNNIKSKQAMKELQEEITSLQESGAQMSQYDLEYLQKKYDLRVAEIALEEAQEAKRTVRLQQDASGNWGYVYTQNEEDTAKAMQTYEDKLYALQEHGDKYLEDVGGQIISLQSEYISAISEIANSSLGEEAKKQAIAELTEYYKERIEFTSSEYDKAVNNNAELYYTDWTNYSELTNYKISDTELFGTTFQDTVLGKILPSIESGQQLFETFCSGLDNGEGEGLIPTTNTAISSFANAVEEAFNTIGISFESGAGKDAEESFSGFKDHIYQILFGTTEKPDNFEEAENGIVGGVNELLNQLNSEITTTALDNILDNMDSFLEDIKTKVQEYENIMYGLNQGLDVIDGEIDAGLIAQAKEDIKSLIKEASGLHYDFEQIKFGDTREANMTNAEELDALLHWQKYLRSLITKGLYKKEDDLARQVEVETIYIPSPKEASLGEFLEKENVIIKKAPRNGDKSTWISQMSMVQAYDTGGYTGQWGPEGRLAMLHQKEIILNASDTANLLASVSLIRDITKQIDLQAAAAASGLGSLAIRNFTDNAQTLQQDVTIHAEFPNVTNHNEIEQAFDTLINRAAQYTNRSL